MARAKAILVALALLAFPAGASAGVGHLAFEMPKPNAQLVTPQGHLVGGSEERWIDEAKVPTVPMRVEMMGASICQGAQGCSEFYPDAEVAVLHAVGRYTLYFELGHLFDEKLLTNRTRAWLARIWGDPHGRWQDSFRELQTGRENGLMVDFAAAYAECALGKRVSGLAAGDAPAIRTGDTCALIRRLR